MMNLRLINYRKICFFCLLSVLFFNAVNAQLDKGDYTHISFGLGMVAPYDKTDVTGSGFYAQGEYVFSVYKWLNFRPYGGAILTSNSKNSYSQNQQFNYFVSTNALLLGAKARISAPIPYVAPYIESGLGLSMGSFETYTPITDIKGNVLKNSWWI